MNSLLASTSSLLEMFDGKLQEFADNVDNSLVWLEEIQQEAKRMFSCDFSAEPELMPKTPSQKKRGRKRISVGHYDNRGTRRLSKGKRSNLRTSLVPTQKRSQRASSLEEGNAGEKLSKRNTRQNNRQKLTAGVEPEECEALICSLHETSPVKDDSTDGLQRVSLGTVQECLDAPNREGKSLPEAAVVGSVSLTSESCNKLGESPEKLSVKRVSATETEDLQKGSSQCRTSRRSSVRHSLSLRRSLAGLRHSMTQEAIRRASRRSFLKKKARMSSSTCSGNASGVCSEIVEGKSEEMMNNSVFEHPAESQTDAVDQKEEAMMTESSDSDGIRRVTRSMIQAIPTQPLRTNKDPKLDNESSTSPESDDGGKKPVVMSSCLRSQPSVKRRAAEAAEEPSLPRKKLTPPRKCQSAIKPNMKSFLHTVQKNQILMMTPGSLSQSSVVKSFIKHTTPLRVDLKERERLRLETLKKKQEQEIERKKKLEEEKRKKQEEMKRKRDERLRKVVEARVKEEQREEEKKKKIELKMAHMEEKNDKMRLDRLAEEKAKRKMMSKRQEELELRKKQEEEARRKKTLQAEEEKRQQELQMKRRAEEEQQKAAEASRALELKKQRDRERELLQEQKAAAEREKAEQEKALAEQRKLEKAKKEKEQREREEKEKEDKRLREIEQEKAAAIAAAARNVITVEIQKSIMKIPAVKAAELDKTINVEKSTMKTPVGKGAGLNVTMDVEKSTMKTPVGKGAGLNVTMDVETSPQSYKITPKGGNKPLLISANPNDYGMDQNSDDSTDDESAPRKPIPSWAEGQQLHQAMLHQYFNPVDVDSYFGPIVEPKLEEIFNKSKPRYFKRTSSAVWQSPPRAGHIAF